ncbi:MAG: KUP/HAK/KT family potassium transporter, partial [Legionellales bacterium]
MDASLKETKSFYGLSFAALGIVFGDIGTSPLYAFNPIISLSPITNSNIYGLLSLIFWTLTIMISFKYLVIVFLADNDGEGGIMALSGLIRQKIKKPGKWLLFVTFIGVGLIMGDGMLTPAISILSAVEGLKPLSADLEQYIVPVTLVILLLLFWGQRLG